MKEMINRVERAICKDWDSLDAEQQAVIGAQARLAIKEIREPTEAMIRAGRGGPDGKIMWDRDAVDVWRDMADAALK
jgi:hypothetical protein